MSAILADDGGDRLSGVVQRFDDRTLPIFNRLALNVVREHAEMAGDLLTIKLNDRVNFESVPAHHEYFELLRAGFPLLRNTDQLQILGWIDEGPDLERWTRDPRDVVFRGGI